MSNQRNAPTRRHALQLLLATPLIGLSMPRAAQASIDEARTLLSQGRAVVYFRHGATTWSGIDSIDWPRERQRLLSDLGIAQSERIGAAFRAQNLLVGEVIASPFARCRDMAEIAFGRVDERMELLGLLSDRQGRADRVAYLRSKLSEPTTGGNRIIVAHRSNIAEVAGVSLGEGDAVVLRPNGEGWDTLAELSPNDW
ncbi:MAG: histidine phosphatase family protein [Paracoccaceae bacterium]|nr:histidine phosphatase family protein [Paracoccaceae bacterium]